MFPNVLQKKNKSKYTLSDHNLNYALNLTENEASGFSFWINFNSDLTCFDAWWHLNIFNHADAIFTCHIHPYTFLSANLSTDYFHGALDKNGALSKKIKKPSHLIKRSPILNFFLDDPSQFVTWKKKVCRWKRVGEKGRRNQIWSILQLKLTSALFF